uniref:Uncharacterized protein n=1 Tax=Oryza nivara TaxID=4536 RepID=A0A0E0I262_ORYNI
MTGVRRRRRCPVPALPSTDPALPWPDLVLPPAGVVWAAGSAAFPASSDDAAACQGEVGAGAPLLVRRRQPWREAVTVSGAIIGTVGNGGRPCGAARQSGAGLGGDSSEIPQIRANSVGSGRRLVVAAVTAAAAGDGDSCGGSGRHGVGAAPSCLLVDVLLVEADSFPFAGGGRRCSGSLRRRWLASVAAATVAVTVEAVATLVAGKEVVAGRKPSLDSFESRRTTAAWRSVTLSGGRSGVSLLLSLCVGDVGVWVVV